MMMKMLVKNQVPQEELKIQAYGNIASYLCSVSFECMTTI